MVSLPSVLLTTLMALAPQVGAADTLEVVRQLYASADYESALQALERVAAADGGTVGAETERFRALCLMALGRTADAELVMERIIRADPTYAPDEQDPPRVRAAFASVRARILPDVARGLYAQAKAAYDRKDYAAAAPGFEQAMGLLDGLSPDDRTLSDLRTLASGFLDLSRAALAPPPPPAPAPAPVPPPVEAAPPAAPVESASPPEVIQQVIPAWNPARFGAQSQLEFRGAVEVVIDENGAVVSARIAEPIHPAYDPELLEAATHWRYRPAQRNGKPVASNKRVDVVLRPRE
jgi:TonB family protein